MDRRAFLGVVGCAAVPLAGCSSGLREADYDVGMSANAFLPDRHEIAVGDTVVWGNNGSRRHTVTAYDDSLPDGAAYFASGGFDSQAAAEAGWYEEGGQGAITPGETYSHTFETTGVHGYYCIPHEDGGMIGTIVVEE